ncbi:MAG: thioredoxin domain-containing protein [Opitutaceae bacterium]
MNRSSLNSPLVPGIGSTLMSIAAILTLGPLAVTAENNPGSTARNHLAAEQSPYLLQHAENPVDWYPWGQEAFARARTEQKPIFLSIGYSTCHWCHVMARESFENEEVAAFLNDHFISIKVDREERPDVDRVYMTYVQATTGGGGWPMSVWLTPDLQPIYGGTYFPTDDQGGRPGFLSILRKLAELWEDDRERVVAQGDHAAGILRQYAAHATRAPGPLDPDKLRACYEYLWESFDDTRGGFGGAPKFPRPANLLFLHRMAVSPSVPEKVRTESLRMSRETHRAMAAGGMMDQLGGGFHRYSVDAIWHVPHFEKMLYDQAQLAWSYLELYQLTGDKAWATVAAGVLDYVERELTHPGGGFYSAEDADSLDPTTGEHGEGRFYTWSADEVREVLDKDAEVFMVHHGVQDDGNVAAGADPQGEFRGMNILTGRRTIAETAAQTGRPEEEVADLLERSRQRLLDRRSQRPHPHLDDKIITAWNGLMISALARNARGLGRPEDLQAAQRAAGFLRENLWDPKTERLYRTYRESRGEVEGFCEDYAYLIQGLIDLYEADGSMVWLEWAGQLQGIQDLLFWDAEGGGYFSSAAGDPGVLVRMKEDYDGAEPAPSSVAASNLIRLSRMLGRNDLEDRGRKTIEAFAAQWGTNPQAMPQMMMALDLAVRPSREIVLNGSRADPRYQALRSEIDRRFLPDAVVVHALDDEVIPKGLFAGIAAESLVVAAESAEPLARVCQDFACRLPVAEVSELAALLEPAKPVE